MPDKSIYPEGHSPKWWKKHPELWVQAITTSQPISPNRGTSNTDSPALSRVLRGLVGPGLIVGGLGVISKESLWPGVVIVYFGCLIFYLEMVFEPWVLCQSLELQCLLIAVVLCIAAWFTLAVAAKSPPMSTLTMDCLATNLTYHKGAKLGTVDWIEGTSDVRLTIANKATVRNLELTVETPQQPHVIVSIGQLENSDDCEFPHPQLKPGEGGGLRVFSKDGGPPANIWLSDMFAELGGLPFSHQRKVICSKLIADIPLHLVVLTASDKKDIAPDIFHIFGSYETTRAGNAEIKVDQTCRIIH